MILRIARGVAIFLVTTGASGNVAAHELIGRIVSIADGDTVTLLDAGKRQHKIRLSGIDAPERRQAFGNRSRQHLAGLRGSTLPPDFRPFSESASSAGAGLTAAIAKALWWHVCNSNPQA